MKEAHFQHLSLTSLDSIFYYRFRDLSSVQQSQVRRTLVSSPAHALLATANYSVINTRLHNSLQSSSLASLGSFLVVTIACVIVIFV
jgi:hypothetical protein